MKNIDPVIFRNETPAPTEPGRYYAKSIPHPDNPILPVLCPVWVIRSPDSQNLVAVWRWYEFDINRYRWFGSVTMVREG